MRVRNVCTSREEKVQRKGAYDTKCVYKRQYEPNASDFTIRSLQKQPAGSSGGVPRDPTLHGVLFESSAHCPDRRNLILCLWLPSRTKAPWPSCFLRIFHTRLLCAVLHTCCTWSPILLPRPLGKWKMAWSSSTSGGPHLLSPTFVSTQVRSAHSSSARNVSSSAPSRTTASGKSVVNFGFATGLDSLFFSESPTFTASWLSTMMNLLSASIIPNRLLSCKPCTTHLDWAVAILLPVCQKLQRIDQSVAYSLLCRVRSKHFCISAVRAVLYDQNPLRGFPIVLAATGRTPHQLHCPFPCPEETNQM